MVRVRVRVSVRVRVRARVRARVRGWVRARVRARVRGWGEYIGHAERSTSALSSQRTLRGAARSPAAAAARCRRWAAAEREGSHSWSTVPNIRPPSEAVSAKLQSRGRSGDVASTSAGSANAPSRDGGVALAGNRKLTAHLESSSRTASRRGGSAWVGAMKEFHAS